MKDWIVEKDLPSHSVPEVLTMQLLGREQSGGPVHAWVDEHANLVHSLLDDKSYGDPLALLDEQHAGDRVIKYVFRGHSHGDLHPGNVLVPVQPALRATAYVLVDLARFSPHSVLSRDPAFLLLCLVHQHFVGRMQGNHLHQMSLIELLADPYSDVGNTAPKEARDLVTRFRKLVTPGRNLGYDDHWREQKLLSIVASALMFLCRPGVPDIDKEWFYRLAARTTRKLAEFWSEDIEDNSMTTTPPASDLFPSAKKSPAATEAVSDDNIRYGNFRPANPWRNISPLTETLGTNAAQLINDVEDVFLGSAAEVVVAYATTARLTINEIAITLDRLDDEEVDQAIDVGRAFDFTVDLGEAREALDRVRRTLEKISRKGYSDDLAQSLRNTAKDLRDVARSLHSLSHP